MTRDRRPSRRQFFKRATSVIGATGATLSSVRAAEPVRSSSRKAGAATEPIAETIYGKVRGLTSPEGIKMFRGVPYGASTAGKNRFMAPDKPNTGDDGVWSAA